MDQVHLKKGSPRGLKPLRRRVLVCTLLIVLPIIVPAGAWRLGGVSALEDDLIYYLPVRQYIGERLAAGEFPLWNPLVCMGSALAADPQSGLWYPATYLFALLAPLVAYPVTIVLHFALAGGGMYRFLRASRHDWRAALLGAIAFEFCGYLVAHRAHLTIHHAVAWLPWIFYCWRRFADRGRYRHFALASLALGMQMLVQHLQVSLITCVLLTGYVIVVLWPRRWSLWWQYPVGISIGICLSAVQLLPSWLHFAGSARGSPAYYLFIENSWVPTSALMLLFPMFFGSRTPNLWAEPWWGISHFCEQSAYGSILVLVLAGASLALLRRHREVAFWWGASLVALIFALGDLTPISKWLFHLPVYRNFRVPARWILVWSVTMPVLASVVLSAILCGRNETKYLNRWVRFTAIRALPVFAGLCLLLMVVARWQVDRLTEMFTNSYAEPVLAGLKSAVRPGNPAIWLPILLMIATAWLLVRWSTTRKPILLAAMFGLLIVDLAGVAVLVDVDTSTYTRSDITSEPPLAEAIQRLAPRPGDRLLVPRYGASYHRPIEVLWPQTNLRYGIATFNGYGPLWPIANRLLFRFMPWGSSEEMLSLLCNTRLLQTMGIRFVAVRSEEENALLSAASWPKLAQSEVQPIPAAESDVAVRFGEDILWPIRIDNPGIYELIFDASPGTCSASRWFLRLETAAGEPIGQTRSLDPVDLSLGRRRLRFLFACSEAVGAARVRVKSEMGHALTVRYAAFGRIAAPPESDTKIFPESRPSRDFPSDGKNTPIFIHRADLSGGVALYEIPGAVELVYWADRVKPVTDLLEAVDCLQSSPGLKTWATLSVAEQPETIIVEWPTDAGPAPSAGEGKVVSYQRVAGHDLQIRVQSSVGGFVVFNESYDPGWRATIDDQETAVHRVNAVCQGVAVPAGEHEVRFVYRPRGLPAGICLTVIAAAILISGFAAARKYRRAYNTIDVCD